VRIYDPASLVPGCTSRSGGYCVVVVDPTADGFAGFSRSLDSSELQNLGLTTLTYQIDVNALPPSQDPLNGVTGLNGETTWQAQYTAVSVSVRLKIEVDALLTTVLLTDSQVDLTLGTVSAYACRGIPC